MARKKKQAGNPRAHTAQQRSSRTQHDSSGGTSASSRRSQPRTTAAWLLPMVAGGLAVAGLFVGLPMLLSVLFPSEPGDGPSSRTTSGASTQSGAPAASQKPPTDARAAKPESPPSPEKTTGLVALLPTDYTDQFTEAPELASSMTQARADLAGGKSPMLVKNALTPLLEKSRGTPGREHVLATLAYVSIRTRDPDHALEYADALLQEYPRTAYAELVQAMRLDAGLAKASADPAAPEPAALRRILEEGEALEARLTEPEARGYVRFLQGSAQEKLGDARSLETYASVSEVYPESSYAVSGLLTASKGYQKQGEVSRAVSLLERLLERYPADKLAKAARTALNELRLVGQPAPDLKVVSFASGAETNLSELKGKVVLVNFWQTWCPHCKKELPHLALMHEQYKDKGLVILGVTKDDSRQNEQQLHEFLAANPQPFPIVRVLPESSRDFAITGIPAAALVDRQGVIRWRAHPNALPDTLLDQLLAER